MYCCGLSRPVIGADCRPDLDLFSLSLKLPVAGAAFARSFVDMSFLEFAQQRSVGKHRSAPEHPANLTPSSIPIDASAKIHPEETVSPLVYSGFIEHLGRCIYGGIVDDPSSPSPSNLLEAQPDGRLGWRTDVAKLLGKGELEIPMMRWPGGNFVSNYHWMDGIGPISQRKGRIELAWRTAESNLYVPPYLR